MTFDPDSLQTIRQTSFVEEIWHRPELDSTNDLALELAADVERELPLLVLTDRQRAGRGRGANRWWSAEGSLTFSLLLECGSLPSGTQAQVALAAGLAVCRAANHFLPNQREAAQIKWPNDVYWQQRKLGGILVEMHGSTASRMVVGIGLNVHNDLAAAPYEVRRRAVSLAAACGRELTRQEVLLEVLKQWPIAWNALTSRDGLSADWTRHSMLDGRSIRVVAGHQQWKGTCRGIDREGSLLLDTDEGCKAIRTGVVELLEAGPSE